MPQVTFIKLNVTVISLSAVSTQGSRKYRRKEVLQNVPYFQALIRLTKSCYMTCNETLTPSPSKSNPQKTGTGDFSPIKNVFTPCLSFLNFFTPSLVLKAFNIPSTGSKRHQVTIPNY